MEKSWESDGGFKHRCFIGAPYRRPNMQHSLMLTTTNEDNIAQPHQDAARMRCSAPSTILELTITSPLCNCGTSSKPCKPSVRLINSQSCSWQCDMLLCIITDAMAASRLIHRWVLRVSASVLGRRWTIKAPRSHNRRRRRCPHRTLAQTGRPALWRTCI